MHDILNESTSIYIQIAEMIENNILQSLLYEGEQAPSTNELARLYSINPATAAKGLNLLAEEGVLYKKRGLGMFVAEGAKAAIQQKRKTAFYSQYVLPLAQEARALGLSAGETATMLKAAFTQSNQEEK